MAGNIVNEVSIRSKIVNAAKQKQYVKFMANAANTRFAIAKEILLEKFADHEVTKELLQEPQVEGSALVDHGNLSTFIGLQDGSLEVGKIYDFLRQNIQMNRENPSITSSKTKISYAFPVQIPEKKEIYDRFPTPDNWHSKSWIELIEKGIGNAASYIFSSVGFSFGESRSGFGLQIKNPDGSPKIRKKGGKFSPKRWLSELLSDFKKKFD